MFSQSTVKYRNIICLTGLTFKIPRSNKQYLKKVWKIKDKVTKEKKCKMRHVLKLLLWWFFWIYKNAWKITFQIYLQKCKLIWAIEKKYRRPSLYVVFLSVTYPLNYSNSWSFYTAIRYMLAYFWRQTKIF